MKKFWILSSLIVGILYTGLRLSPSSYGYLLEKIGHKGEGLIIGHPRPIRSDEWAVITPFHQILAQTDFNEINQISPYKESLLNNYVLPIKHIATLFRPQTWGFFILPADFAYSFEFIFLSMSIFWGMLLLLRYLAPESGWLLPGLLSLAFVFTSYIQFFLATIGPIMMMWPLMTWFLLNEKLAWKIRLPGFAFSAAVILGALYPPSTISLVFVSLTLWIATRPIKTAAKESLYFGFSSVLVIAAWYLAFHEYIHSIINTVYPGQRSNGGGGFPSALFWTHFVPGLFLKHYEPMRFSNICENSTITALPIFLSIGLIQIKSINKKLMLCCLVSLCLMGLWIWAPVPEILGKILLWHKVQSGRMVAGFGSLLFILGSIILLNGKLKTKYYALSLFAFLIIVRTTSTDKINAFLRKETAIQLVILLFFTSIVWYSYKIKKLELVKLYLACSVLLIHLSINFYFNPVQKTSYIFKKRTLNKEITTLPGATMQGLGIPSFQTTLARPQEEFFRKHFPNIPENEFRSIFSRYAHITFEIDITVPYVKYTDHIAIPRTNLLK